MKHSHEKKVARSRECIRTFDMRSRECIRTFDMRTRECIRTLHLQYLNKRGSFYVYIQMLETCINIFTIVVLCGVSTMCVVETLCGITRCLEVGDSDV